MPGDDWDVLIQHSCRRFQYVGDYPDYPTTISIVVGILIIHELRILIHQKYLKGT